MENPRGNSPVRGGAERRHVLLGGEPLGLVYIFGASAMWAAYIVLGKREAALDRGLRGLGVGLANGALAIAPFGISGSGEVVGSARLLGLCVLVGALSSAIGYTLSLIHISEPPRPS